MATTEYIEHDGTVVSIHPEKGTVKVRIDNGDECGQCPAATLCGANGKSDNLIEVAVSNPSVFSKGEEVKVEGTERMHRRAIMLATVLPSIAILVTMVAVYLLTANQLLAAVCGIAVMIIFFVALYLARNKIAHEFTFTITKC